MPFINYAMHPDKDHTITVNPALLVDEEERVYAMDTPAEKLEHSKILWAITVVFGFVYIVYYFVQNGFTLGLNIVNMIFLFLGILLHGDLRRYVDAIAAHEAAILRYMQDCNADFRILEEPLLVTGIGVALR